MLVKPLSIFWWAVASFCGGCGLAIPYSGTSRNVLYVGVIALIGNEARLLLGADGVPLSLATFLGALAVGLTASWQVDGSRKLEWVLRCRQLS